jgi:CubicO group peptidase (beta-lactamase class C family)
MRSPALPTALPEEIGLSSARLDRLTQVMRDEVARGRVPGAVALISRRGKIGYFESCGQRDPVKGTPMTQDAIFRIYSMTKPILTVAAMMLFEEGRFLLSDPVSKYLPELGNLQVAVPRGDQIDLVPLTRPVTIQDLLRHTSGSDL